MKGKIKKALSIALSTILTVEACVMTVPALTERVYAAGTGKNLQLGHAVLSEGCNTANAATVYYDSNSDAWRVIGYDGTGVASESGTMTLIAKTNLEHGCYDLRSAVECTNVYADSNLRSMIGNIAGRLSESETSNISTKTLDGGIENAVMWPLTANEAEAMDENLRKADPDHPTETASFWWLRTPSDTNGKFVKAVKGNGEINSGTYVIVAFPGVRPAFNLNLSSILFTSAAMGGKSSGTVGAGALTALTDYDGSEWKLTLLDGSRNFSASRTGSGNVTAGNDIYPTLSGNYTRNSRTMP